jgi:hypothetical protein
MGLTGSLLLVLAAERSCSSFTPGVEVLCEEELPKIEEPSPEVIEEMPQPPARIVRMPHKQKRTPQRAATIVDCVMEPRPKPSPASILPFRPKPLGRRRRLPVLLQTKPSTPS